jgi:hypothetical protein
VDHVYLIRNEVTSKGIRSVLFAKGKTFYTLERPWVGNERNISCIPSLTYYVKFLESSASGKYKNVYHIQDVPGRGGVLIHNGNIIAHTRGCVLIGLVKGILRGMIAVLSSKVALRRFVRLMEHKDFILHIIGTQSV